MKYSIGFNTKGHLKDETIERQEDAFIETTPRKSVVEVYFPDKKKKFSYYNDMFDLKEDDMVFVEGVFEGIIGIVVSVNYSFKIKLSDYKRVIGLVSNDIHGELFIGEDDVYAFDKAVIPYEKILTWFMPPQKDVEYAVGTDEGSFPLDDLTELTGDQSVAEKGVWYFKDSRVVYLTVEDNHGRAIVEGGHTYEVEFDIRGRDIYNLTCSCFCANACKHEFAVMLKLKVCLDEIEEKFDAKHTNYFAMLNKSTYFYRSFNMIDNGRITLG